MTRLAKLDATRALNVTDVPFKPSNPGKKGTFGMIKTNLGGKAGGVMGEFKYAEQVGVHKCADRNVLRRAGSVAFD